MAESDMNSSRLSVAWRILLHHYCADRQAWNHNVNIHKRGKNNERHPGKYQQVCESVCDCVYAIVLYTSNQSEALEDKLHVKHWELNDWQEVRLKAIMFNSLWNHILYINDIHLNAFIHSRHCLSNKVNQTFCEVFLLLIRALIHRAKMSSG